MNLEQNVTVLSASRLDFETQDGNKVKGVQVWYHGEPVNEENQKGCKPAKAFVDLSHWHNYEGITYPAQAVAIVEVDLTKGRLKATGFKFKTPAGLNK